MKYTIIALIIAFGAQAFAQKPTDPVSTVPKCMIAKKGQSIFPGFFLVWADVTKFSKEDLLNLINTPNDLRIANGINVYKRKNGTSRVLIEINATKYPSSDWSDEKWNNYVYKQMEHYTEFADTVVECQQIYQPFPSGIVGN